MGILPMFFLIHRLEADAISDHWASTAGSHSILGASRSEEHTSELQSQSNLVCRLLLEKKKKHVSTPPAVHAPQSSFNSPYCIPSCFAVFNSSRHGLSRVLTACCWRRADTGHAIVPLSAIALETNDPVHKRRHTPHKPRDTSVPTW